MQALLPVAIVAVVLFTAINVAILRWVFRINKIVKVLESIDRSLQYLPAVRDARAKLVQRRAA